MVSGGVGWCRVVSGGVGCCRGTDNASNISLRTFLENNGGDINDILNDFGVGS